MGVVIQGYSFSLHCRRGEAELTDNCVCLCHQQTLHRVQEERSALCLPAAGSFLGSEWLCVNAARYNELGRLGQQLGRHKKQAKVSSFSAQKPWFSPGGSRMLEHSLCQATRSVCFLASAPSLLERLVLHFDISLCFHPLPIPPSLCSAPESFCSSFFFFAQFSAEILAS